MAPDIADALAASKEAIGYEQPIELYVRPEPMFNAFCMRDPAGHVVIGLSSHLLESFTPAELQFVIGHELGHAAFDHFAIPMPATATIEDMAGVMVSRPTALDLFLWCRAAELSADRIGLLCTRDPESAASSFFKLASGLASPRVQSDLEAFASQVDSLASTPEARAEPRDEDATLDCFSTHPYSPVRVRALLAFSRSRAYSQLTGLANAGLADADVAAIIDRDFALMEPTYLDEKSVLAELMRKLLYHAGVLVAAANGQIVEAEIEALRALLGERVDDKTTQADPAAMAIEFAKLAKEGVEQVDFAERARLVQHLTIVAAADGQVDDDELAEMARIATSLEVPAEVIHQTLQAAKHPMD
jgi:uncharacterized tellurite resistance protein B-like protein